MSPKKSSLKKKGGSDEIPKKHFNPILTLLQDDDVEAFDNYLTLHEIDPRKKIYAYETLGHSTYILHLAVDYKAVNIVKHLLNVWGIDVNQGEFDVENTALFICVYNNDEKCLDILLQQRNLHIDCLDDNNATPLMMACANCSLSIIKKLLLKHPDIHLKDDDEKTVLDYAKEHRKPGLVREITELILASQKKKSSKEIFSSLQQADSKKYRLTKNTEYIDSDYTSVDDEQTKESKNYFFNTQNTRETSTQGMKDINRVFDEKILEHIDEGKVKQNPFTRQPWSKTRINEFQQKPDTPAQQGGQKEYHTFNARRYVVRTGPKGGRFIVVKQKKIYV